MYFPFELCTPSYSGRSAGEHFLRRFLYELPFSVSRLLNHLLYFRNLDDEHGCQMLFIWCKTIIFTAKRSIKSTFKNAKFDLFRSEKANWQIRMRIEIG